MQTTSTRDIPVFELFAFPPHLEGVPLKVGYAHAHGTGLKAQLSFDDDTDAATFDIFIDMRHTARTRDGACYEVYGFRDDGKVNLDDLVGLATRATSDVFTVKLTIGSAVHTLEMRTTGLARFASPRRHKHETRSYLLAH
jgi:hypothetical protein